jgi:hypothetical protein
MPHANWTHTCKKTGRTKRDWKPFRCWRCFGHAEFSGWSNSVVEMMGDYQRLYGLICIGPHRPLADQVFAGAFTRCATCAGSGHHDDLAHRRWGPCKDCDGLGRRPAVSQEDVERRRAIVLAAFPGAARPRGRQRASLGRENAPASAAATVPAAAGPLTPVRRRAVVSTGSPASWELLRATLFVLVLAPAWLFGSVWSFRVGQMFAGTVLLFASAFAAMSGLMTASPSSFDRKWLWVWGGVGLGFFLLLAIATGQSACGAWADARISLVNGVSMERSIP